LKHHDQLGNAVSLVRPVTFVRSGARGGLALAGIATAIVIALWFVFYLFVFMPRVPSQ